MFQKAFHGPYRVRSTPLKAFLVDRDGKTVFLTPDLPWLPAETQAALLWTLAHAAEDLNQAEAEMIAT